jgi:hypothetical protein
MVPSFAVPQAVLGRPATVTPKDGAPIPGVVVVPGGRRPSAPAVGPLSLGGAPAVELREVIAVPRDVVPSLPIGSTILVSRDGQEPERLWRVDRIDDFDPDCYRAVVS